MRTFIQTLSRRTVVVFFGAVYTIALLMAVFPPFYLAASGRSGLVLGIPFSIFYWLLDFAIVLLGLWGLYVVEDIRGELDEAMPKQRSRRGE